MRIVEPRTAHGKPAAVRPEPRRRSPGQPPPWARATQRALTGAGVDSTLEWYDDGHTFGPAFVAAMDRTVRFLRARMPA